MTDRSYATMRVMVGERHTVQSHYFELRATQLEISIRSGEAFTMRQN